MPLSRNTRGFLLIEALIAASVLTLLAVAVSGVYVTASKASDRGVRNEQARLFAEEGINAARVIVSANPTSLNTGSYGISTSSNSLSFKSAPDTFSGFERTISITPVSSDIFLVTSSVSEGTRTRTLQTYVTRWREAIFPESSLLINTDNVRLTRGGRFVSNIDIQNQGTASSTIHSIDVSWGEGVSAVATLTSVFFSAPPTEVWSGVAVTPANDIDIDDVEIASGSSIPLELRFSSTMSGSTVTLTLHTDVGAVSHTFSP